MTDIVFRTDPRYTPYQAEFFHRFVTEVEPGSVHLLLAPVGTGKSFVIARCISELARTGRLQRVLILSPAVLAAQWAYIFSNLGQELILIDGRTLRLIREQIGSAPNKWPKGVYAMSIDLAKRHDVHGLVSSVPWDLVAVDDAHALIGQRLRLVEDLAGKEHAPAMLLATHVQGKGTKVFADRAKVFDWGEAVADFRSRQGDGAETPLVRTTRSYQRSDEEVAVAQQVLNSARELGQLKGMALLQLASSSISSLEDGLIRWVEEAEHSSAQCDALEALLQQVEQLRGDSRLECFIELVEELIGTGIRHIVVFCEYRATLEYLAAGVERLDFPDYQFHGGMPVERRTEVLRSFESEGGLLITTSAVLKGVSLNFVDAAIHYDLPVTAARFAQREGRYRRHGRRQPCTVYFLKDETGALRLEGLLLKMVHKIDLITDDVEIDMGGLFRAVVTGDSGGIEP